MIDSIGICPAIAGTEATLTEVSEDKNEGVSMVVSPLLVFNFDKVKDAYCRQFKADKLLKSVDALYRSEDDEFVMVEFKNGRLGKGDHLRRL